MNGLVLLLAFFGGEQHAHQPAVLLLERAVAPTDHVLYAHRLMTRSGISRPRLISAALILGSASTMAGASSRSASVSPGCNAPRSSSDAIRLDRRSMITRNALPLS